MPRLQSKNQQSSIDRLPDDIREQLQQLLRDPRVTQLEATARINAVLAEEGHGQRLSKSSVNRYAVRMEHIGAKLRESREVAQMWIGKWGSEPAGEVGKLLNEMVRNLAFRAAMRASEDDEEIDPNTLKALAIAVHRLEQAAEKNASVEKKIREQALAEASEKIGKAAKDSGIDAATIERIQEELRF